MVLSPGCSYLQLSCLGDISRASCTDITVGIPKAGAALPRLRCIPVLQGSSATSGHFPELGGLLKYRTALTFSHSCSTAGFMLPRRTSWNLNYLLCFLSLSCCFRESLHVKMPLPGSTSWWGPGTTWFPWEYKGALCWSAQLSTAGAVPSAGLALRTGRPWLFCSGYLILHTPTTPGTFAWLPLG